MTAEMIPDQERLSAEVRALWKRSDDLYARAEAQGRTLTRDEQRAADHANEKARRMLPPAKSAEQWAAEELAEWRRLMAEPVGRKSTAGVDLKAGLASLRRQLTTLEEVNHDRG